MILRSAERAQFLADIITGAIEGGTGYWASVLAYRWQDREPDQVYAIVMVDDEEHYAVLDKAVKEFVAANHRKPNGSDLIGVKMDDTETPLVHRIDIEVIARGITAIKNPELRLNSTLRGTILAANVENEGGNIDSDCADVIVQAAIFGEVVYG